MPEEDIEPPDPIPIELAPLVAPYRKRGRVTVRVERLPHRARLSHGQNNGDRSWSLALDELDGLAYLPANSADEIQTLSIRIIRVDGGDAATLAVLDYALPSSVAVDDAGKPASRSASATERELRNLRDELARATVTLESRTAELAELRRAPQSAPARQAIETELAALRASWEAEVQERLALAEKASAADLEKSRAAWRAEEDARVVKAEKEWRVAESRRLADAQAKWQQQSARALADEIEKSKSRIQTEPVRSKSDDAELLRLREELAKARASLAQRDGELANARSETELLRADKAKLGRLSDDLTRSKTVLDDREAEAARARADAHALRNELEKTKASLTAREGELRLLRSNAEQTRAEAESLRNDSAELKRLNSELASAKASLAVRDAELARTRASQEEARTRWRQEADAALLTAQEKWKDGEAERFAAAESTWREHSQMAIAEVITRLDQAEARALAEIENNRSGDAEIRRLSEGLAQAKVALGERENELVQARLGHEQARERWLQETQAAISKAQQAFKASEAQRIAASESEGMEQSALALANMTAQVKQLETALADARSQIETLRHRGDSADFRQLRKEFASLQATLASRESELRQLRSDHEIDRERWTSEARVAVKRADYQWQTEDAEETERKLRAQTARRLLRDALIASAFVGLAMLGYYQLAPMLSDSAPDILQPILNQAGIATGQPSASHPPAAAPPPSLLVVRSVNLRGGPSTTAAVIASLPRNAKVTPLEQRGNWVHVQFANGGDKPLEGWAFKTFLSDAPAAADASPAPPSH